MERTGPEVRIEPTRCPFCHEGIPKGVAPGVCSSCHALHHAECLEELGRCAGCGAATGAPATERPAHAPAAKERVELSPAPAYSWRATGPDSGGWPLLLLVVPAILVFLALVASALR